MKAHFANSAIAGAAALAMVAVGSLSAPVEAKANDRVAGALVGGLVAGAIIGSAVRPVYGAPVYAAPVYRPRVYYAQPVYRVAPRCAYEPRRVWDPYYGGYVVDHVRVCY
jgi:hypothetical protein